MALQPVLSGLPSNTSPHDDSVSDIENWPDKPLLMQSALAEEPARVDRVNSSLPLPINNDVFEGWAIFWAAGLASTPEHMFNGHKRKTSLVVQGKFKQALPFNAVLSGQRFSGPLQHLPASWLTSTILKLVHHINPAMVVGTVSSPSLLAPLVSMAQCINVSQPGTEPSLNASPVEDMRLLGSQFQSPSGTALPANERKHLMTNKEACSQHSFDCEHVWTLHFWQHFLDVANCTIKLPFATIEAAKYLGTMPISIQASTRDGQDLWSWKLWHEKQFAATSR
ncbi:TPA: hypothetical protein ACH3X3_002599 [Trebouxia sp. C0006]